MSAASPQPPGAPGDPDAPARPGSGLFGLDTPPEESAVWVFGAPFDATCSYRRGTALGPQAILRASHQVDLTDLDFGPFWREGIHLFPEDPELVALGREARALADPVLAAGGVPADSSCSELAEKRDRVDAIGEAFDERLHAAATRTLEDARVPALLGGEHSVSFGFLRACAERHPGLGVLHLDAHADLRTAYEGFRHSHASIFQRVLDELPQVARLCQVGLRDLGEEETERLARESRRVRALFDNQWARVRLEGGNLAELVQSALADLPEEVYVSVDVDGLDPSLCPHTGTPVPGGLTWHEAVLWLQELVRSGRRIVGFDLVEVAPSNTVLDALEPEDSWDAIVGARLLYKLCGAALASRSGPRGNAAGGPA